MKNTLKIIAAAAAFSIAVPATHAAVDYFLEVDGIQGESTAPGHAGHIDLETFALRAFQKPIQNVAGNGATAATSFCRPVTVVKPVDKSSPPLFISCMTAVHLKKVVLYADYVNEPGSGPNGNFLKITLEDVQVATFDVNNGDRQSVAALTEAVTFSFNKITINYKQAAPNGTLVNAGTVSFDLGANKKLNF